MPVRDSTLCGMGNYYRGWANIAHDGVAVQAFPQPAMATGYAGDGHRRLRAFSRLYFILLIIVII